MKKYTMPDNFSVGDTILIYRISDKCQIHPNEWLPTIRVSWAVAEFNYGFCTSGKYTEEIKNGDLIECTHVATLRIKSLKKGH